MDYSQLNDAEVAQKAWFWWNQNIEHDNTPCAVSGGKVLYVKNSVWTAFDPCNNPADAWPIISSNKINIEFEGDVIDGKEEWWSIASWGRTAEEQQFCTDDNPLRAAMIVFLMMQDAKHA